MRSYKDPNKSPLFRGGERMRLMAAIGSLVVIGTLIGRARDPNTWRWFAGLDEPMSPSVLKDRDRALGRLAPSESPTRPPLPPNHFILSPSPRVIQPAPAVAGGQGTEQLLALATDSAPPADGAPPATENAGQSPSAAVSPSVGSPSAAPPSAAPPSAAPSPAAAESAAAASPSAPSSAVTSRWTIVAHLADDVPPPEATLDPRFAGAGASEFPVNPEYQSSIDARNADVLPPSKAVETPIDQDPIERSAFQEDAQAITDRKELRIEEMAAYWRLVDWERAQTFKQMDKRARRDLVYSHFFKDPEKYRGELVRLNLRIDRATATDADEQGKARGLARTYEAWGYTEESSPNHYVVVLTNLPSDFPLRHDMQEDVTFVGYFFKLMAYQSRDDKHRAVPLLIGQAFWHQNPAVQAPINVNWLLAGAAGVMALVMLAVRLTFNMRPLRPRGSLPPLGAGDDGAPPIETWLERIEESPRGAEPPTGRLAMNGQSGGEHPTNGSAQHHQPEKFTEDPDA